MRQTIGNHFDFANHVNVVAAEEIVAHLKTCHIARVAVARVPVAGNLHGILFKENRIEDRLPGQPRRKSRLAALLNERQFVWAGWAKEGS